jgi:Right handed beta helix region
MSTTEVNGWYDFTDPAYGGIVGGSWSTAIGLAIAAMPANGGVLYVPPGDYPISASIPLTSNISVLGGGPGLSVLSLSAPLNIPILTLTGPTPQGITVQGVALSFATGATSGAAGIEIQGCTYVRIVDVNITNAYTGIHITGLTATTGKSESIFCDRVNIQGNNDTQFGVQISGGAAKGNQEIHFTDCILGLSTAPATGASAINLENCQAVFMTSCYATGFYYGFHVNPTTESGDEVFNIQIANSFFSATNDVCRIENGASTNLIYALKFTGCTFTGSTGGRGVNATGVVSGTTTFSELSFSNCNVSNNDKDGIAIAYATNVQITGCNIYDNDSSASSSAYGVYLLQTKEATVNSSLITGTGGTGSSYGVYIDTGCSDVLVNGCDVTGNTTTTPAIFVAATPAQSCQASNNLGFNPQGYQSSGPMGSGAHINPFPQTATVYVSGTASQKIQISNDGTSWYPASPNQIVVPATVRLGPTQHIKFSAAVTAAWFLD